MKHTKHNQLRYLPPAIVTIDIAIINLMVGTQQELPLDPSDGTGDAFVKERDESWNKEWGQLWGAE